jgi:hypothetical protein
MIARSTSTAAAKLLLPEFEIVMRHTPTLMGCILPDTMEQIDGVVEVITFVPPAAVTLTS